MDIQQDDPVGNLDGKVEELRRLAIHEKSRKQYNASNAQFIIYLMEHNPILVTKELKPMFPSLTEETRDV